MGTKTSLWSNLKRVYAMVLSTSTGAGVLSLAYHWIEGLFPAFITWSTIHIVDEAEKMITGASHHLWFWCACMLSGYIVKELGVNLYSLFVNASVYEKVMNVARLKLYEKSARLPYITFEDARMMDKRQRAKECVDQEKISQIFVNTSQFIINIISIISIVGILSSYHILFLPISLASVAPYLIVRLLRGKEFDQIRKKQVGQERRKEYMWKVLSEKETQRELRVYNAQTYMQKKWQKNMMEVQEETQKHQRKETWQLLGCDGLNLLGYGVSMGMAVWLILQGEISAGAFSACAMAFLNVQNQVKNFLVDLGSLPGDIYLVSDYFDYLELPEEEDGRERALKPEEILFDRVCFSYPQAKERALDNVSFRLRKGEKIAIVGENGSGKTTLMKLLFRLYTPQEGKITVNGEDLEEWERKAYYGNLSVIQQQFVPYQLSVRENVGISDVKHLTEEERIRQCLAQCALQGSPFDEIDQRLGKRLGGRELSYGQWQKVAIARGIFKNAEWILLDEPTSALDPMTEAEILHQFLNIVQDKTAVIITHRIGLCTRMDRILVMRDGRIIQEGSHQELMAREGEYRTMFLKQGEWYRE